MNRSAVNLNWFDTKAVFTLLHTKGDKIATAGEMLGADAVYEAALKYAQTDADRSLVSNKRNKIASPVSVAKAEQEKVQREQEKKREKERRKDEATDKLGDYRKICVKELPIKWSVCEQTGNEISAYQPLARKLTAVCAPKRESRGRFPGILSRRGNRHVRPFRDQRT